MIPKLPLTTRALFAILLFAVFIGCVLVFRQHDARQPERTLQITKSELNALLDSLANKNQKPGGGGNTKPIYSDDYDFKEDRRVHGVARTASLFSGEELWLCMQEHFDDERYAIAQQPNERWHIYSIGDLCRIKAAHDLDEPFQQAFFDDFWRPFRLPLGTIREWCRTHQRIPLYQQQIKRGNEILKKLETHEADRLPTEMKADVRRKVEQQIETLKRTKKPIASTPLIGRY